MVVFHLVSVYETHTKLTQTLTLRRTKLLTGECIRERPIGNFPSKYHYPGQ